MAGVKIIAVPGTRTLVLFEVKFPRFIHSYDFGVNLSTFSCISRMIR